jgi:hypothetical protein
MTHSRDTVGGQLTMLRAGRFRVRIPAGERDYSLFQIVQTGSEAPPASYSIDTGIPSRGIAAGE